MLPVEVAWRKLIKRKDTMPSKNQIKKQKTGFTIIEVVLVLAIAGLIFLMVFVALPALQRSQRDTQRRQDYADLSAAITSYATNHNGSLPTSSTDLDPATYINKDGKGPTGTSYTIKACKFEDCSTDISNVQKLTDKKEGTVLVVTKATCSDGSVSTTESVNSYAIYGPLETGTYCQSNN